MKTLRVAIVGAGKLGQTHARHWRSVPGASVVAAVDVNTDAAKSLLAQGHAPPAPNNGGARDVPTPPLLGVGGLFFPFSLSEGGGGIFSTVEDLLASADVDIVDICTPTPLHKEAALLAARAGKSVFIEKPLARTLSDCDAIVNAAAQEHHVPIGVAHVVRYFPAYRQARKLIRSGAVGAPVTVRMARLAGFPTRPGMDGVNWYADPAQSGGVILDALLHDFDWLLWCFGPVTRVHARDLRGSVEHIGKRDYALVTLRFASGVVAHVTGSWAHSGPLRASFEVCGDSGLLEYDSARTSSVVLTAAGGGLTDGPLAPEDDPYFAELVDFARCVRNGLPPPVPASEARDAVRVALAALHSADTGQAVAL